ncbi:hypothetical protein QZH41_007681 [Actinostola sp. cb2023]|nr:hypothetical protein QZH41_007681 [Actinostola sp. cb2023]
METEAELFEVSEVSGRALQAIDRQAVKDIGVTSVGKQLEIMDLIKHLKGIGTLFSDWLKLYKLNYLSYYGILKTNLKQAKEIYSTQQVQKMFEMDFNDRETRKKPLSLQDQKFLKIVEEGIRQLPNGHYEMPLPFKTDSILFENNIEMALKRLTYLKKRFQRDEKYRQDYVAFMQAIIDAGHAERVEEDALPANDGKVWYIPHHGVYHPKKQEKIRVVFDCSATFKGESLNKQLLQGPDLANSLVGVLCRFRLEPIAFMCDIEKMFHQVKVRNDCRDYLRFLWWDNADLEGEPKSYRMTVHLFGAVSSPGCANYGLKKTADDFREECGERAADFIKEDFYVDDGLKSVSTVEDAVSLIKDTRTLCSKGGFRLHKFTSNTTEVIQSIPKQERADGMKNLDMDVETMPIERALGVQWCVESDTFQFRITLKDRPFTRRGISVFDPLGLVAPVILLGKRILQSLCQEGVDWDEKCSYLRVTDDSNQVHCSLVMAKSRVSPLKPITIPSKVVLGYISNEARRFHTFVSNRVQQIRDHSTPDQWHYVDTKENPADHASRGLNATQLTQCSKWWNGPDFLQNPVLNYTTSQRVLTDNDPEVKKVHAFSAQVKEQLQFLSRLEYFSDWHRARKAIALCLRLQERFKTKDTEQPKERTIKPMTRSQSRQPKETNCSKEHTSVNVNELRRAEQLIIKELQREYFNEEIQVLSSMGVQEEVTDRSHITQRNRALKKTSSLYRLDPFLDKEGLLRVGGRLKLADIPYDEKYPMILPRKSHITSLILCHFHERVHHQGRGITQNEVRASGYWAVGGKSVISHHISKCVKCRKLPGATQVQKMADLPKDRLQPAPPFTYSGVDCFGPWLIKEGRREVKRYGVLFTCMASRAIHIEVANSMETDSFINAYRRFVGRRGPDNCDWVVFKMNHPDLYSRKRWRRVQYLANEFWIKWRKTFLQSLQQRPQWTSTKRNIQVDDVVIVKEEGLPRNKWLLARVTETYPNDDGKVRKYILPMMYQWFSSSKPILVSYYFPCESCVPLGLLKLQRFLDSMHGVEQISPGALQVKQRYYAGKLSLTLIKTASLHSQTWEPLFSRMEVPMLGSKS